MRRRNRSRTKEEESKSEYSSSQDSGSGGGGGSEGESESEYSESESEDSQNEYADSKIPEKYKIQFKEVLPYLKRGDFKELYEKKGDKIDLSHHFDCRSTEILIIVSRIIKKRSPKRGDIFKFAFLRKEEQGGYFFWNGKKAIVPEQIGEEEEIHYIVPSIFKVPIDFSVNHWNESGFTGFTTKDLCYDTTNLKFSSEHYGKNGDTIKMVIEMGYRKFIAKIIMEFLDNNLEEIFTSDCIMESFFSVYYDKNFDCYIIMFYGEDEKRDVITEFFDTGRCSSNDGWEATAESVISDRKRLQNIIRKVNNKVLRKEKCVYVHYAFD
jgi:hypothetical protein